MNDLTVRKVKCSCIAENSLLPFKICCYCKHVLKSNTDEIINREGPECNKHNDDILHNICEPCKDI